MDDAMRGEGIGGCSWMNRPGEWGDPVWMVRERGCRRDAGLQLGSVRLEGGLEGGGSPAEVGDEFVGVGDVVFLAHEDLVVVEGQ